MKLELNTNGNIIMNESNVMEIMRNIVNNNITNVRHYLKKELGIEPGRYYTKLRQVEIKYPKYYEYYINNLNKNMEIMREKLKYLLLYVGTFMKYGVELEDGSFRNFDMFDWYIIKNKYFDNLNRKELSSIIDELSKDPIILEAKVSIYSVRKMISISFNDQPISSSYNIHKDVILNDKKSGLTEEEKKFLVKFMEKNNIIFNFYNYEVGRQKLLKQRKTKNDLFNLNIYVDEDIIEEKCNINSLHESNVLKIMKYIIDNNIVNIRYFINKELNLNYNNYQKKLLNIQKKYPEEYELYKNITEKNLNEFKQSIKIILVYILVLKKYGIELEDGSFREFDLFDFYSISNKYFANLNRRDLLSIFDELYSENKTYLTNFNFLELRHLINYSSSFNLNTYDSIDLPISENTILMLEDELNIEEKTYLINYMKNNKIPFTFGNYKFGISKMLKQRNTSANIFEFDFNDKDIKKKIK